MEKKKGVDDSSKLFCPRFYSQKDYTFGLYECGLVVEPWLFCFFLTRGNAERNRVLPQIAVRDIIDS